jgi:hypothetical protein
VPCIESRASRTNWIWPACLCALLAVGCGSRPVSPVSSPAVSSSSTTPRPGMAAPSSSARTWDEYRVDAARRIVAANPGVSHTGVVAQPLLAIPVLEIELNGDGSVRAIKVMREPSQAKDTTQIAIDAVRRAGPFGDVTRLPKPWRFSEVFLFGDDRRFKPRTLDE